MNHVEHVLAAQNRLGEGPVWHPDENALYWLDILDSRVSRLFPASNTLEVFDVGLAITVMGLRASGGWVTATARGFAFWDPDRQEFELIADPEAHMPHTRFNDGAVDHQGRFWAGTMNHEEGNATAADGSLYRLDPDGSVHKMGSGFTCSNGIGWSPDHRTMYFTDTFRCAIIAYDFDPATGTIENRRDFVRNSAADGYPDGLAVDSEGCVWSARWGGWKVVRFDPEGNEIGEVRLPVANVTSCTFGGPNYDELYMTSAWDALSAEERKRQPLAGDLFRFRAPVRGLEPPRFLG